MRQADKQQPFPIDGKASWRKLYRCSFDDHPTSAPHRLKDLANEIADLFCKPFKRTIPPTSRG